MSSPTDTIRERVLALLSHIDVTDAEFGRAIGRGYSWVSAFRSGTRPATDIDLIVKIAKYFGVTVGYLLRESERPLDSGAMTLVATWNGLTEERDRLLLLRVAATLRPNAASTDTPTDDDPTGGGNTTVEDASPRKKKHR